VWLRQPTGRLVLQGGLRADTTVASNCIVTSVTVLRLFFSLGAWYTTVSFHNPQKKTSKAWHGLARDARVSFKMNRLCDTVVSYPPSRPPFSFLLPGPMNCSDVGQCTVRFSGRLIPETDHTRLLTTQGIQLYSCKV
jgi:hypothetical protein